MTWIVPPECQGQIVEVAYATSCDGLLWRRVTDRSDRSVTYEVASADSCGCEKECACFSPQNAEPCGFDWEPVLAPTVDA
jgi:hypothetical protein